MPQARWSSYILLDYLTCLLRNLYAGQEATCLLEPNMEKQTGSKLGKEYVKAVYCHPAYLTSAPSTSCKIGWMNHKLESRLPGEISTTSDMQIQQSNGRKQKETKDPLDEGETEE